MTICQQFYSRVNLMFTPLESEQGFQWRMIESTEMLFRQFLREADERNVSLDLDCAKLIVERDDATYRWSITARWEPNAGRPVTLLDGAVPCESLHGLRRAGQSRISVNAQDGSIHEYVRVGIDSETNNWVYRPYTRNEVATPTMRVSWNPTAYEESETRNEVGRSLQADAMRNVRSTMDSISQRAREASRDNGEHFRRLEQQLREASARRRIWGRESGAG